MPSPALVTKLNEQISHEFASSNLYLAMSAWCATQGLRGSARFLAHHADEEMQHMRKLFSYLIDVNAHPIVPALAQPAKEFGSLKEIMGKAFEHEKFITSKIYALTETALAEKDFGTFNFLQWYVAEQREEEELFQTVNDIIELAGTDGRGLYLVDKEIGKLVAK
jgi:ferritin